MCNLDLKKKRGGICREGAKPTNQRMNGSISLRGGGFRRAIQEWDFIMCLKM